MEVVDMFVQSCLMERGYRIFDTESTKNCVAKQNYKKFAVAGDRTRVTRVTGGNTYHYTTTT